MPQTINKKTAINGVVWSGIERFSVQGIQFLLSIVIARLILPSDYGIIAMLSIFLAIAQCFIDCGFSNALIQKQNRTENDFSTVFYFNIFIGIILYSLFYISAPYIAIFYDEPQLIKITKIVGINILINSLTIIQRAKLIIELKFKIQATASLISIIISGGISVWIAYKGYGVWALIFLSLLNNMLIMMFLWISTKWIPSFLFSKQSFISLFRYGSKLLLSGLLHTLYINLYTLAIGKKMSATQLGYYNRAYTLAYFPSSNITEVLHKAMFPILCSIQNDEHKLRQTILSYMRMACYIIFPMMFGLCALAAPFVEVILTERWNPIVPILQILCIAYMWDPIMRINNHFLYVKGRTDYTLKAEILKKIVAFIILITTIFGNLYIISIGLVLYSFIDIYIITRYTKKQGLKLRAEIKAVYPIFLLALSMGLLISLITHPIESAYLKLIIGIPIGIIYYIIMSKLTRFSEISFLWSYIKTKIK